MLSVSQPLLSIYLSIERERYCILKSTLMSPRFQFVPFRDYIDRSGNQVLSMARLAKDVLAEIPDQLLSFMKSRGVEPRPALSSSPLPELHHHIWPPHSHPSPPLPPWLSTVPPLLIYAHLPYGYLSLWRSRRICPLPLLSPVKSTGTSQGRSGRSSLTHPLLYLIFSSLTHPVI